jgi:hypothetical protein
VLARRLSSTRLLSQPVPAAAPEDWLLPVAQTT